MSKGWEFLHKWLDQSDEHSYCASVIHSNLCISMTIWGPDGQEYTNRFMLSQRDMRNAYEDAFLLSAMKTARELREHIDNVLS